MEIGRSYDRLISTMGFPILVRWHLYIDSGPWSCQSCTEPSSSIANASLVDNTEIMYMILRCPVLFVNHFFVFLEVENHFLAYWHDFTHMLQGWFTDTEAVEPVKLN